MNISFELNEKQLLDIAQKLKEKVLEGLHKENQQIKCLLTYVPVNEQPRGNRAIVIDLGGTNVRSALISMEKAPHYILKGPLENRLPLTRGVPLDRETYLRVQADLISELGADENLPLGYCFSFPAKATFDGDAVLLNWTKGIFVPDTVGEPVGKVLRKSLMNRGIRCSRVSVINDTVASLFAGLTMSRVDSYIGLIVGTGNNMASFIDSASIHKMPADVNWEGTIPVNLESGNFHPPHLNAVDEIVDAESENPGEQRFEKAVSGAYLGRVFKAAYPESDFDPSAGSRGLVELAFGSNGDSEMKETARQILERSAKLVAASLAGLISLQSDIKTINNVRIVAEGSLIWKAPGHAETTKSTLIALLKELELPHVNVELTRIKNANLIGSAMAALAG